VSAPVRVGKLKLSVRPSIGIARSPADGVTTEALLKSADAAMYRAKREQTGYAFFDDMSR
jgi:predicted signal transduction protein with EAL and GGDEF domain